MGEFKTKFKYQQEIPHDNNNNVQFAFRKCKFRSKFQNLIENKANDFVICVITTTVFNKSTLNARYKNVACLLARSLAARS